MNRNYYCKVNSQEEADELLDKLKNIGESIVDNFFYNEEWCYMCWQTKDNPWHLLPKEREYLGNFEYKQEVPANELVQYVKGELPKKEVEFEVGKWYVSDDYYVKYSETSKISLLLNGLNSLQISAQKIIAIMLI